MADTVSIDKLFEYVKLELGPIYKAEDEKVLKNIIELVKDEALSIGNRMVETPTTVNDFKSIIIQTSIIAYQNRGVEGQTRQGELGQDNHFIDWHQYLRDEVVRHGKRYVI